MKSFDKYKWKLVKGMITGNFLKYMQPINMIKNYYGEKYAFEFAFLVHYFAWLIIPGVSGVLVSLRMGSQWIGFSKLEHAIDTDMNGLYGIFIAVWASCFLESWRKKQEILRYVWNCSDCSFSQ